MDVYSLVLLSVVSSGIWVVCQVIWTIFLIAIQPLGYTFVTTRSQTTIVELQKMACFSTEIDGGSKGGVLLGRQICGVLSMHENYDELRCIVPKSMLKKIFEIDPKHVKEGYYLRIRVSGWRNRAYHERCIMRSIPKNSVIRDYQSDIVNAAKTDIRAFLICGPQGIGKSSTAGIIAHQLGLTLLDNISPETWSIRQVHQNVVIGKTIVILLDEIDVMLNRLVDKKEAVIKDMYVPTVTGPDSWNAWIDTINNNLNKEIILVCTSNMSVAKMDAAFGSMVREGRFMRIDAGIEK